MKKLIIIAIILISSVISAYDLNEIEAMLTSSKITELPDIAKNLSAIGSIHHAKKDYSQAIYYYNKSILIREKLGLEKSSGFATVLFLLSIAKDKLGDSCNALNHANKSMSIYYYLGKEEDARLVENEIQLYNTNCNLKNNKIVFF